MLTVLGQSPGNLDIFFFLREQSEQAPCNGKTVAVLGVGAVGGHMARICGARLGMRVLGLARTHRDNPHVDRYFERADLHAALGEADALILALALTRDTARIIDAAALGAMKPTAFLVNVARGDLIDGERGGARDPCARKPRHG